MKIVNVADLVEENDQTIRENSLARQHKIPVGTLVEVKYDRWYGGGSSEKVHARLFVVEHNRDCDGTPLYSLCGNASAYHEFKATHGPFMAAVMTGAHGGFDEEDLTPIEITPELVRGEGSLTW